MQNKKLVILILSDPSTFENVYDTQTNPLKKPEKAFPIDELNTKLKKCFLKKIPDQGVSLVDLNCGNCGNPFLTISAALKWLHRRL